MQTYNSHQNFSSNNDNGQLFDEDDILNSFDGNSKPKSTAGTNMTSFGSNDQ